MKTSSRSRPGAAEGLPDLGLVAVGGGRVDVAVAGLERLRHGRGGLLRRDLEDAEAELGDLDAVVEGDLGNLGLRIAHTIRVPGSPVRPNRSRIG